MQNSPWNSLEVAKLAVSAATPLLVFSLGVWLQRTLKRIEQLQWSNRKLVERRLQAYDELAPHLNDLLCYFAYVGNWKEFTPRQMVDVKRRLDKKMHLAAPLFTGRLLELYNAFIKLCFKTFNEMGADAQLRTDFVNRRPYSTEAWKPEWEKLFAPGNLAADPKDLIQAYERLISSMTEEIGVGLKHPHALLAMVRYRVRLEAPRSWWEKLFASKTRAPDAP